MTTIPPKAPRKPWATVTVVPRPDVPVAPEAFREQADQLDALAGLLAELADVSGVQTVDERDPRGDDDPRPAAAPPGPYLIIYTVPSALEEVDRRAVGLAESLGLSVSAERAVRTDDDWLDGWRAHYRPLVFGDGRLLLRPSWIPRRPDHPTLEIVLDPGRAFGTGLHESTRLCLESLCRCPGRDRAVRALDLGCGSGVLALAIARLFPDADPIVAIDHDADACETTRENADRNGLSHRLRVVTGTMDDATGGPFDMITANIRPAVLIPGAVRVAAALAPGGWFVLGGILREEGEAVAAAYADAGLEITSRRTENDWVALEGRRPTA